MIKSITFTQPWRGFKVKETFSFDRSINLLVGDQGCGKSSLISAIRANSMKLDGTDHDYTANQVAEVLVGDKLVETFKFDFEKDNHRTLKYLGKEARFQILSTRVSHGESNKLVLENVDGLKNSVIFMDEPDMALSIRSVYALVSQFKRHITNGNQIVAAVHNPILIENFSQVLSLEHRQWMPSRDFIQSHSEEA